MTRRALDLNSRQKFINHCTETLKQKSLTLEVEWLHRTRRESGQHSKWGHWTRLMEAPRYKEGEKGFIPCSSPRNGGVEKKWAGCLWVPRGWVTAVVEACFGGAVCVGCRVFIYRDLQRGRVPLHPGIVAYFFHPSSFSTLPYLFLWLCYNSTYVRTEKYGFGKKRKGEQKKKCTELFMICNIVTKVNSDRSEPVW